MQHNTAKKAQSNGKAPQGLDPRFAALARLLARDLARKHFDQEKRKEQLKGSPEPTYDADSDCEDQS